MKITPFDPAEFRAAFKDAADYIKADMRAWAKQMQKDLGDVAKKLRKAGGE